MLYEVITFMPIYLRSEGKDREINSVVSGRMFQTDQVMVCQLKAKQRNNFV